MAVGRAARRAERSTRVESEFGAERAAAALDLLELTEFAWHDCHGEVTPPDAVIDDVLALAGGDLAQLVHACRLAVEDARDLRVAAEARKR